MGTLCPAAGRWALRRAIVGGGCTGLSAALAQGGARVTPIAAHSIGFRASGRNGWQVVPGLKRRADRVLAAFGAERGRRMLDFAHAAAGGLLHEATRATAVERAGAQWTVRDRCRHDRRRAHYPGDRRLHRSSLAAPDQVARERHQRATRSRPWRPAGQAALGGGREDDAGYPVTPLRRVPFYPLRQPGAAAAIMYYRMKDRLGLPS